MGNLQLAHLLVQIFFYFLMGAFLVTMLLSWFPVSPSNPIKRFCTMIIAPILDPLDRRIPPIGIFRVSFIIAFWALIFARGLFLAALPTTW
jgi:YggT family protein